MTRNVRALILAALLTALIPVAASAQTLAWDASPDADVTGYVVAYGTSSGTYTNTVNVGNVTSYALPRLDTLLWARLEAPMMAPIRAFRLAYLPLLTIYLASGALGITAVADTFWVLALVFLSMIPLVACLRTTSLHKGHMMMD